MDSNSSLEVRLFEGAQGFDVEIVAVLFATDQKYACITVLFRAFQALEIALFL